MNPNLTSDPAWQERHNDNAARIYREQFELEPDCDHAAVRKALEQTEPEPTWLYVLRRGFLPLLSPEQLRWLRQLAETDDKRLIQGDTTQPDPDAIDPAHFDPPIDPEGETCVGACLLGCLALAEPERTVADVRSFFAQTCFAIEDRLNAAGPGTIRALIVHFDDEPRDSMRATLIREIDREMSQRKRGNNVNATETARATGNATDDSKAN